MVYAGFAPGEVLLRDARAGAWRAYRSPRQVIVAHSLAEVLPALRAVENATGRGLTAAGFLSYEAAGAFDAALTTHAADDFPLAWFGIYERARDEMSDETGDKSDKKNSALPEPDLAAYALEEFQPNIDINSYRQAIEHIHDRIRAGDTYQVNYTLRLRSRFTGDPWQLFLAMARAQPAGYPAFINTGRYVIASASPELFFHWENGQLTAKPMKGTVRRGRDNAEDAALSAWLRQSEKNRAENLMIVDMIRNDLGRVARTGSVRVPELFATERHPTLWQMTSTVTAFSDRSLTDIMTALFPCASITGAPKVSTMRVIRELEPQPRRIYTGAIGYIAPGNQACFSVAIRTALVDLESGSAEYGAGGGIVIDSAADDEYAEALLKARVFTSQPPRCALLETLRWTPEEGYFLLREHLERLRESAVYFDYPCDLTRIQSQLAAAVAPYAAQAGAPPLRARLLLERDGQISITVTALDAAPLSATATPLRVTLAAQPVDSSDIFLYHKTTRRQVYEAARAAATPATDQIAGNHAGGAAWDDVLLWNERGEVTETTIANLVAEIDGRRLTPPVAAGLLPGCLRRALLERGEIVAAPLRREDLPRATRLWRINSVRGWEPIRIE